MIGCVDDLRSRKIHNNLLLGLLVFAIAFVFALRGISGLGNGLMSAGLALALTFPLVYFQALGGGDMKLFAVFALTSDPTSVIHVYIYSIVAGALIGLIRAAVGGQLMTVLKSTALVAMNRSIKPSGEFNIPFSAALVVGWMIHCTTGATAWTSWVGPL
jgi:Flp pilus assembly protein protease CpaA